MPSAIDVSSVVGLIAIGIFTAQILLGLLLSVGYNPIRGWPRVRGLKLFTFHNWLAYIGLATAFVHPVILLASPTAGFRIFDLAVPIWSPTQPIPNTLGAIAFYLVTFVVATSYFRTAFAHHTWKLLHYTAYAAAAVFCVHGVWADPLLKNRPPDFIDAEKAYVEGCAMLIVAATIWRFRYAKRRARVLRSRLA
ncbi:MAG TPA: ferric reductase-like transmembrane domain-containing protein [Vicinamibacterales bacterium]|nr:ferric reductase-like transmembrane domain-containing protein [Vicinamibacterales bacterium]